MVATEKNFIVAFLIRVSKNGVVYNRQRGNVQIGFS